MMKPYLLTVLIVAALAGGCLTTIRVNETPPATVVVEPEKTNEPATLKLDKATYKPGESIVATFANGPGNSDDWFGVFKKGDELDDALIQCWYYANGGKDSLGNKATKGTVTLDSDSVSESVTWPLADGTYEVTLFCCDSYDVIAGPVTIDVGTPSLKLDKSTYKPGENIAATFANGPGNSDDWIGVFKKGDPNEDESVAIWYYTNGTKDGWGNKATKGTVTLDIDSVGAAGVWPLPAGDYEVTFFCCEAYDVIAGPVDIKVGP